MNRIFQKTNSKKLFPSKPIAIKIALSKTARFYFEHIIDSTISNQVGIERASLGNPIVPIAV